eukprot:1185024-Pleurochrysis_carterae.AAC.1
MAGRSATRLATVREQAQARRGLGAPTGAALGWDAVRQCRPCVLRGIQILGSRARALRKYACDANAIWETVHAGVNLQFMVTFPRILLMHHR